MLGNAPEDDVCCLGREQHWDTGRFDQFTLFPAAAHLNR